VSRSERAVHRPSRIWPARLALFCVIAVWAVAYVAAHGLLAPYLVRSVSRLTHGSPTWMFTAGWVTAAFVPAAVWVFLRDGYRRDRQLGDDPRNRPRAGHGHAVAGRGSRHWISRLPLLLPIILAFVFAPSRGAGSLVVWSGTLGGDSFYRGWQMSFGIALPALIALLACRLLAFLPDNSGRLLRVVGPWVAAAPALALFGLYSATH
jgi:hypothetical protein